jgi:acyl carrier protein
MSEKQKPIDLLPEELVSYEEAAEFWDNNDTTDNANVIVCNEDSLRLIELMLDILGEFGLSL